MPANDIRNRFLENISDRMFLLKTALGKRYINTNIIAMASRMGPTYRDVRGDVDPIGFLQALSIFEPNKFPDFSVLMEDQLNFTPQGLPEWFNSEPSVGRFLGKLVCLIKAEIVIELGCFVGWTTAHIARAMASQGRGRIFAVDPSDRYLQRMIVNLSRHGLSDFAIPINGLSTDEGIFRQLPNSADIIFLDTSHAYPATLEEVGRYSTLLRKGGLLVLHDSISAAGVRRSLLELSGFDVLCFATELGNGVAVLRETPVCPTPV